METSFYRKRIRLQGYDYSQIGYYYITVCPDERQCIFGDIVESKIVLNELGSIVNNEILQTDAIRNNIKIHNYCVMPNHIHLLIEILNPHYNKEKHTDQKENNTGTNDFWNKQTILSKTIKALKGAVSRKIGYSVWQRSYYDRIIRTDEEFDTVNNYIDENPVRWEKKNNMDE